MSGVPVVSPAELCPAADDGSEPTTPVVGVDLSGPVTSWGGRCPDRILVGLGPVAPGWTDLVPELDLTLVPTAGGRETVTVADPVAVLADLGSAVAAAPRAAVVLARLLRWSVSLPVPAALDAESAAYSMLLGGREFSAWLRGRGPRPLPADVDEPVRVSRSDSSLFLTLNRPERRNAYGGQLRDALVEALRIPILDPSVRRVVIDGAGPVFCSGGDLAEFGTTPDPVLAHLVRTGGGAGGPLHAVRERTEVRLHGACVGAGVELPAFAGHVVAAPRTTFRLPELGMGLIPGAGGTVSLPRRIGRHRTLYLSLLGRAVDADLALSWGLVDEIDGRRLPAG